MDPGLSISHPPSFRCKLVLFRLSHDLQSRDDKLIIAHVIYVSVCILRRSVLQSFRHQKWNVADLPLPLPPKIASSAITLLPTLSVRLMNIVR